MGKAQGFATFLKCRAGLNYSFVLGPFFGNLPLSINGVSQMDEIVEGWEHSLIKFTTWITKGTCMEINGWIWMHIKMDGNDHRKCVWISFTLPTTFMSSTSLTKFHQFGKIFICLINCIHVVYDINVIHMIIVFHHYCQFHPCLDITYPSTYWGIANVANPYVLARCPKTWYWFAIYHKFKHLNISFGLDLWHPSLGTSHTNLDETTKVKDGEVGARVVTRKTLWVTRQRGQQGHGYKMAMGDYIDTNKEMQGAKGGDVSQSIGGNVFLEMIIMEWKKNLGYII